MRKLLTLISAVGLGATGTVAASNVVSCSKKDSFKDLSKIDATKLEIKAADAGDYKAETIKTVIVKVINDNISIGTDGKEFKSDDSKKLTADDKPTKVTFTKEDFDFKSDGNDLADLDGSKDVNVDVTFKAPEANSARAKALGDATLKGTATFKVDKKSGGDDTTVTDLAKVITKKDLGEIDNKTAGDVSGDEIVAAIIAKNSDFKLKKGDLSIVVKDDKTGATISGKEPTKVTGSVDVTFTLKKPATALV